MPSEAACIARLRGAFVALGGFVCIGAFASRAAAQEAAEPVHLRFEVEEALAKQCPDAEQFMQLLHAERRRLVLAAEGAPARTFGVRIRRGRDGLTGEVVVTAATTGGASYTRSVEARDCTTLARALAVVAALASDVAPVEEPQEEHVPGASEPGEVESPREGPPEDETAASPSPSRAASVVSRVVRPPSSPAVRPVWRPGVGIGTELVWGTLPQSAMGYRAYFELRRELGSGALAGRASFAYAGAPLPGPAGLNAFIWTSTARLEGCASRRVSVVSIEGCAGATSGVFVASSEALGVHDVSVNPWLAFGLGARGRWHLTKSAYSELFCTVNVPATTFDGLSSTANASVHFGMSPVVGEIGLGVGYFFGDP